MCWFCMVVTTLIKPKPSTILFSSYLLVHGLIYHMPWAGAWDAWAAKALPRSEVFARSGVLVLFGVLAFSSVRDRPNVLARPGDGPCPDLADRSILFLQTWGERVRSGTWVLSGFMGLGGFCWLTGSGTCLSCGSQFHFTYDLIEGGRWRSGWTRIKHPPGGSMWRHEFLDFF